MKGLTKCQTGKKESHTQTQDGAFMNIEDKENVLKASERTDHPAKKKIQKSGFLATAMDAKRQ